jgi:hypothetical protein
MKFYDKDGDRVSPKFLYREVRIDYKDFVEFKESGYNILKIKQIVSRYLNIDWRQITDIIHDFKLTIKVWYNDIPTKEGYFKL